MKYWLLLFILLAAVTIAYAVPDGGGGGGGGGGSAYNPAIPGAIGGTTSNTGQFTQICTGTSPCTLPGATGKATFNGIVQVGTGINDGTNILTVGNSGGVGITVGGFSENIHTNDASNPFGLYQNTNGAGFDLAATGDELRNTSGTDDNAINSWPRTVIDFAYGASSVVTATNFGVVKLVKAITIENFTGAYAVGASCSAPVIRIYDCGASAPANAACSGGTQLATVTLGATAGTEVDGTIVSANVAAGEYVGAQIQAAGSCTTLNGNFEVTTRPQ